MNSSKERFEELAMRLARRSAELRGEAARPELKLAAGTPVTTIQEKPPRKLDWVTRESHLRMIRQLRHFYGSRGIGLVVDQALEGKGTLDDLSDDDLLSLRRDIDAAIDCIRWGTDFIEANLIRSR